MECSYGWSPPKADATRRKGTRDSFSVLLFHSAPVGAEGSFAY